MAGSYQSLAQGPATLPGIRLPVSGQPLALRVPESPEVLSSLTPADVSAHDYRPDNNWSVLRYSDVLLILAEAINEQAGPDAEAVGYLN